MTMVLVVVVSVDDIWVAICVVYHVWDKGGSVHVDCISFKFDLGWGKQEEILRAG
jgi:hypothetical protein